MSWHRQYRGQNIGRVLHFLYHYCGFDVESYAEIGLGYVMYRGEKIATFEWLNEKDDIPIFKFLRTKADDVYRERGHRDLISEMWQNNQRTKLLDAIQDQEPAKDESCRECQALKLELSIYKHKA